MIPVSTPALHTLYRWEDGWHIGRPLHETVYLATWVKSPGMGGLRSSSLPRWGAAERGDAASFWLLDDAGNTRAILSSHHKSDMSELGKLDLVWAGDLDAELLRRFRAFALDVLLPPDYTRCRHDDPWFLLGLPLFLPGHVFDALVIGEESALCALTREYQDMSVMRNGALAWAEQVAQDGEGSAGAESLTELLVSKHSKHPREILEHYSVRRDTLLDELEEEICRHLSQAFGDLLLSPYFVFTDSEEIQDDGSIKVEVTFGGASPYRISLWVEFGEPFKLDANRWWRISSNDGRNIVSSADTLTGAISSLGWIWPEDDDEAWYTKNVMDGRPTFDTEPYALLDEPSPVLWAQKKFMSWVRDMETEGAAPLATTA